MTIDSQLIPLTHTAADWYPGEKTPVLVIHGGGWNAMDRHSIEPVVRICVAEGHAVLNTGYRLLDVAPWPACLDDCIEAAQIAIERSPDGKIIVIGASAGGQLALMTACRLGSEVVSRVISISGVVSLRAERRSMSFTNADAFFLKFFGYAPTEKDFHEASPLELLSPDMPPVSLIHSRTDELVQFYNASDMKAECEKHGIPCRLFAFDGSDSEHGIWCHQPEVSDFSQRALVPEVIAALRDELAGE